MTPDGHGGPNPIDPGPALADFVGYVLERGLIASGDTDWAVNRTLEVLHLDTPGSWAGRASSPPPRDADSAVAGLLEVGVATQRIGDTTGQRDLLDAALFGALMPPPSAVADAFFERLAADPVAATDAFYRMSVDANYIHAARSESNPRWRQPTAYGDMDITINLAKPEKDPRDIAAAASMASGAAGAAAYPQCLLCRQNEGYAGRLDHPARQNLRLVPLELAGRPWALQYSPYLYYPEHCIVLDSVHQPMRLTRETFARLLDFVTLVPHYFLGSNADLPIVGGSILSHDHFQGGRYRFPIEDAEVLERFVSPDGVVAEVLNWPLATVRLTSADPNLLGDTAMAVLTGWRHYDEPATGVVSHTGDTPHNTVTPIARRQGRDYQVDIVLRNNRTSAEHPDGIFHPHAEIHPVKRENIGLIEVMGLAVLPGRLASDMPRLAQVLQGEPMPDDLVAHQPMVAAMDAAATDAEGAVRNAVGQYFVSGLEHCGVFGVASAALPPWRRFLDHLGYRPG